MSGELSGAAAYTSRERAAIIASAMLGFGLDMYDILLLPFLMPSIRTTFGASQEAVAWLVTATLIGSVVGGGLFGWLGDRLGRRTALQLTLWVFAAGAVASAFSTSLAMLAALRFITGIGLGGEWGAGMVLFNEVWDRRRRGLGSACVQGCASAGAMAAAFVGTWAIAHYGSDPGWRVGLVTGGAPILLIVFIRFFMPESKLWLEHDRLRRAGALPISAKGRSPLIEMFNRQHAKVSVVALVWMMAYMFAYYSVIVFIPTVLLKVEGAPNSAVRTVIVTGQIFSLFAYLTMGTLNDRMGRRFGAVLPVMMWIGAVAGMWLWRDVHYAGSLTDWPMFWLYLCFVLGNCSLAVAGPWLSELFPTEIRSTAVSTIYMGGRAVGAFGPIVVPMVAGYFGGQLLLGMMVSIPASLIFLLTSLILPETAGRAFSAIETAYDPTRPQPKPDEYAPPAQGA